MSNTYTGLGKRKTSIAKVFLKEGSGIITVNGKSLEQFFGSLGEEKDGLFTPLILLNLEQNFDIDIKVKGGGVKSQFEACRLAISKAILTIDSTHRQILKAASLLTRDSRIKERRKYGLKKARKASQYSKR
jgi:small subunit ribosomal protein S9